MWWLLNQAFCNKLLVNFLSGLTEDTAALAYCICFLGDFCCGLRLPWGFGIVVICVLVVMSIIDESIRFRKLQSTDEISDYLES